MSHKTIRLHISNGMDMEFNGTLVAKAEARVEAWVGGPSMFPSEELRVYKTVKETIVCERTIRTDYPARKEETTAKICMHDDEIIEFFGWSSRAKEIYCQMGIECVQRVD